MILFFALILIHVYIVRGPSTERYVSRYVPTERYVSTEYVKSGLQASVHGAGSGTGEGHGKYVSAHIIYNVSSHRNGTSGVLSRNSNIPQSDVNTTGEMTLFSTNIALMNRSVTWQGKCDRVLCKTDIGKYLVNVSACRDKGRQTIRTSTSFTIHFLAETKNTDFTYFCCELEIITERNQYINATVRQVPNDFTGLTLTVQEKGPVLLRGRDVSVNSERLKNINFTFFALRHVLLHFESLNPRPSRVMKIDVNVKEGTYLRDLPVVVLTDTVGYVTSPGFNMNQNYPNSYDGIYDLNVRDNDCVLVHIIRFEIEPDQSRSGMWIGDVLVFIEKETYWYFSQSLMISTRVFHSSFRIYFHTDSVVNDVGFKIMFAILTRFQLPEQLPSTRFNCSVPSFHSFKLVFSCNIQWECEDGDDERDCEYRNNDCGVEDAIDIGTKCYSIVLNQAHLSWLDAKNACDRRGQTLATFETPEEFRRLKSLVPPRKEGYFVGVLLTERAQPVSTQAIYRNIWQWVDGSTVFSVQIHNPYLFRQDYHSPDIDGSCGLYSSWFVNVVVVSCHDVKTEAAFVCELYKQDKTLTDIGDNVSINRTSVLLDVRVVECSSGHMTRDFMSCDFQADCDVSYSATSCNVGGVTVPMFVCQRTQFTVHYSLVCDHMQHCTDNSDEDFCEYPVCPMTSMKCSNGQCIPYYLQCDRIVDCYDGSDETLCPVKRLSNTASPPGLIYLDGGGTFRMQSMHGSEECLPTHFLCPRGFCLPVYLRCNGVVDCVDGEDEVACDRYKCRGFYRCRGSKTCLHPEHVCDDIPQCPEQDDDLLCNLTCPDQCRCQGLAFVCTSNFSVTSHLAVRYLDASGSNMTLNDVSNNNLLIGLRLSKCHIIKLPFNMTFPNLRELDLSWNKLYRLQMQSLYSLKNLRILGLSGNPVLQITNSKPPGSNKLLLERVDLSHTKLEKFSGSQFANSPHIKMLNFSFSQLKSVTEDGFHFIPELKSIDLRGSRLTNFPRNLLRHLTFLRNVHAENYKLCCEAMLPVHFDPKKCHATPDLLASCEDLLKSNSYRVVLWIFAVLSLVGNVFSVWARWHQHRQGSALSTFSVFVINLSVADFFMGVYLATIGTADFIYRGRYLWRDDEWKNSEACHMAGFFCLLSSETSAFIVCVITLDRFLVLRFPFGRLHFGRRSALFVCGAVWTVGISLAAIPMLPRTSNWDFYSQTGICIPLPFTNRETFDGYDYSFGVSILLNLVLFLLIAVGQAFIYFAVRASSMPFSTDTRARDAAIARRLITVVVSDFLCWFPIGLLGLLASTGTPIPGEVNVVVATVVLPVNSALNPFLYTFNLLMEKRRKAQNEELLRRLKLEINQAKALTQ